MGNRKITMEKYTDKIRNIYQETLALDTIYNVLSWHERTTLHQIMTGGIGEQELTENASMLCEFVNNLNWKTPLMKYGQDRLLYFYDETTKKDRPIEDYIVLYPNITNELNEYSSF